MRLTAVIAINKAKYRRFFDISILCSIWYEQGYSFLGNKEDKLKMCSRRYCLGVMTISEKKDSIVMSINVKESRLLLSDSLIVIM